MIFPIPKAKYAILKIAYEKPEINISNLFKSAKVSPKAGYNYLNELRNAEILSEWIKGERPSVRLIQPNLSSPAGRLCYSLIEEERKKELLQKNPKLKGPFSHFEKEAAEFIETALVFGSFARGTYEKDSDLDLLIIAEKRYKKKISLTTENCFVTLPNRVSLRLVDKDDFVEAAGKKEAFIGQIIQEHIVAVNSEKFIELLEKIKR